MSKTNVGKNSKAIFQSFVRKRIKSTYAIASTAVIHTSANTKFFSVKKAKTNNTENKPKNTKNSIDGKICFNSTSRDTANTQDK